MRCTYQVVVLLGIYFLILIFINFLYILLLIFFLVYDKEGRHQMIGFKCLISFIKKYIVPVPKKKKCSIKFEFDY